jgi:hypothetical protein
MAVSGRAFSVGTLVVKRVTESAERDAIGSHVVSLLLDDVFLPISLSLDDVFRPTGVSPAHLKYPNVIDRRSSAVGQNSPANGVILEPSRNAGL